MELEVVMQKEIMQVFRIEFLQIMRKVRRVCIYYTPLINALIPSSDWDSGKPTNRISTI